MNTLYTKHLSAIYNWLAQALAPPSALFARAGEREVAPKAPVIGLNLQGLEPEGAAGSLPFLERLERQVRCRVGRADLSGGSHFCIR